MATWESGGAYGQRRSVISTQAVPTEPQPTSPTDGLPLQNVGGFTLHVECEPGHTFTAAGGKLLAYLFNPASGRWSRCADKNLDLIVPIEAIGRDSIAFSGFQVATPRDRIAHVANSISVTGGGLKLYYTVTTLVGTGT